MSPEDHNTQHFAANRAWWDAVVPVHEASRGYNREGFLRGEKPLCPVELAALGAALCWLPDIRAWARVVASCLDDGGLLYVYEGHPVLWSLNYEKRDDGLLVTSEPYFERPEPTIDEGDETYVDGPKLDVRKTCCWNHGLGEIITALIDAGLRIKFVHEHREVPWQALVSLEPVGEGTAGADGRYQSNRMWRLPEAQRDSVPLMYSLLARNG